MNFDGPVLAWLILALLPIAVPVLLAVILRQLTRIQTGCLPLAALLVIGVASAFAITEYLDSRGVTVKAEVLSKKEFIVYHLDGSWNRKMAATVSYRNVETDPTTVVTLNLMPGRFDEMNQGDFILLRCPDKPGLLSITRLDDQKVYSQVWYWMTNQPFLLCFVLGLLIVLGVRFMLNADLPTLFFLSGLVTIGAWWTASVGIPWWSQLSAIFGSLNSLSATVREVHPPYLGSGVQGWISTTLYRPTDLILLDIIPVGHTDPILSVDQVDQGTSNLRPGQGITVDYSAANPRLCLVPDAARSYVWKNGLISSLFALLALVGIGRFALSMKGKSGNLTDIRAGRKKRAKRASA